MSKVDPLTPVTNLSTGSAITIINDNYDKIEEAFDNTISRDGSTPNQMNGDIDMNGNDIINVGVLDLSGTLSVDDIIVGGSSMQGLVDEAEAAAAEAQAWAEVAETFVLPDNSIATIKIIDDAITTPKIADANVTLAKLASNSVDASKIVDGSVGTVEIADDAVTYAKIQNVTTSRLLGRVTAGSGDMEELTAAQLRDLFLPAGSVVDSKTARYTANANLTAQIPYDDTIPQITEGTEIISTTFTMKSVTNILRLRFRGHAANSIASPIIVAVFIAGDANAKTAAYTTCAGANYSTLVETEVDVVPGVMTALTISVRAGPGAATTQRWNGDPTTRLFGGAMGATLTIEEIKA